MRVRVAGILGFALLPSLAWSLTPDNRVQVTSDDGAAPLATSADTSGRYTVIWSGGRYSSVPAGVYMQRYARDGSALGGSRRVLDSTNTSHVSPLAAIGADGRFVIVSTNPSDDWTTWDHPDLVTQCFNADGSPRSAEVHINVALTPRYYNPAYAVGTNANGVSVVGWMGIDGARVQRFDRNCNKVGGEIALPMNAPGAVVVGEAGNFEAFWYDGGMQTTVFQRFAPDGTTIGTPVTVGGSNVASNRFGDMAITWVTPAPSIGAGATFHVQRYDRNGLPKDAQPVAYSSLPLFAVDAVAFYEGLVSDVEAFAASLDDDGDVILTWSHDVYELDCESDPASGCLHPVQSSILFGQRLVGASSSLSAQGQPFKIAAIENDVIWSPQVALDGEGNFLVTWYQATLPEKFDSGDAGPIYARHYRQNIQNERFTVTIADAHYTPTPVPGGPAGYYSFNAQFCNSSFDNITNLSSRTSTLTNGNMLLSRSRDGVPSAGGAGSSIDFPKWGALTDGVLKRGECATVPYVIGLATRAPFSFSVDVLGDQGNEPTNLNQLFKSPAPISLPGPTTVP